MSTAEKPDEATLKEWHNDPKNWKLGFFYYNKKDPRFLPPSKSNKGRTINFASPDSIIAISAILIIIYFLIKACKG